MAKTKTRHGLIAALDVGTTKVCCFIARATENGGLKLLGVGHQLSRGMRNGAVVDMEEAETSIRATVEAAEEMAGERIHDVAVNLSTGQPTSNTVTVEASVNGHDIGDADIRRMMEHARHHAQAADRELIHCIPVGFTVDGHEGVRDPRGMFGNHLAVSVHLVTAALGPVRNLVTVVNRCHLGVESKAASAYCSGLAALVDDEKTLGVTCIDMGGGATTIAVFQNGHLVHTDAIPVGGMHVTNDIARGLSTPLAQAERLKTLFGAALPSASDDREVLKVPLVGEDEDGATNQIQRSMLVQIIRPRLDETFELVRSHLEAAGFDKAAGRRVVLTGGAAQMQGARELAGAILNKQVRMGRPIDFDGLPEATGGPAFATCAGLLRHAQMQRADAPTRASHGGGLELGGPIGRLAGWLKTNF